MSPEFCLGDGTFGKKIARQTTNARTTAVQDHAKIEHIKDEKRNEIGWEVVYQCERGENSFVTS
jgi:hypothetical protein